MTTLNVISTRLERQAGLFIVLGGIVTLIDRIDISDFEGYTFTNDMSTLIKIAHVLLVIGLIGKAFLISGLLLGFSKFEVTRRLQNVVIAITLFAIVDNLNPYINNDYYYVLADLRVYLSLVIGGTILYLYEKIARKKLWAHKTKYTLLLTGLYPFVIVAPFYIMKTGFYLEYWGFFWIALGVAVFKMHKKGDLAY